MQEVKNELSSIKALLLSRSQFPTSPCSAGIPSWQMLGGAGPESVISDDQDPRHVHDVNIDNSNGNETVDSAAAAAAASRRRKNKSQKSHKSKSGGPSSGQGGQQQQQTTGVVDSNENNPPESLTMSMTLSEVGSSVSAPGGVGSGTQMRKHPSVDSNNGFHSGSSCEVVFVGGKNDSDRSDD